LLAKVGDGDFLRAVAEAVVQMLMEADVEGVIGAGRHERTGGRTTYGKGYRDRSLDTRLGSSQPGFEGCVNVSRRQSSPQ
jgi:transposase-like protein